MGPLQKGYENGFAVEGGELKHINRKGCFKHSESVGKEGKRKKKKTTENVSQKLCGFFTVLVVV